MPKCRNCGEEFVPWPIFKEPIISKDPLSGKLHFHKERLNRANFLWKNIFKFDLNSIIMVITIALLIFCYKVDISECQAAINDTCEFCEKSGCLDYRTNVDPIIPTHNLLYPTEEKYITYHPDNPSS